MHDKIRGKVFSHIKDKAKKEGYYLDSINGTIDHVHCLLSLNPKYCLSEVINKLKGESSHWINAEKLTKNHFAWQNGYSAFSVSESLVAKIRSYIRNQETHHAKLSFKEEVEKFLKLHKAYDKEGHECPSN